MTDKSNKRLNHGEENTKGSCLKVRYIQVTLLFFLMFIMFLIRTCLSVAIVAMTTKNTSSNANVPTYNWENSNIILSSFYWSYAPIQFVAGNLAQMYGAKKLLLLSLFMNSLSSLLIPITAQYFGANGVMGCRIIQGLFQGFMLPLLNTVLGRWIPPNELSLVNTIVYAGNILGVILSMVITGYFSASSWGWPTPFYAFGALGLVWCFFWMILSAETPALHKGISKEERKYIEQSLGQEGDHLVDKASVPWKAIFKSLPYWAIIIAAIGESWSSTFLSSELPSYFSHAVGLNIEDSSLFSSVPVVGALITGLCCGPIATYTINKGYTSKVNSRRIFHGIGLFSTSIGLVLLPFIETKMTIAILMIVSQSLSVGVILGHFVNLVDISPRYSGILTGIANGTGQFFAIFAPILVHFIVTDETDKALWRSMFILAAGIGTASAIFFIIFCSGEKQWWDNVDQNTLRRNSKEDLPEYGEMNLGYQSNFIK